MIERILVAVDDSAPALAAVTFAIELAGDVDAELHVVTVAEADRDPDIILRHVAAIAAEAGLTPTLTALSDGKNAFESVLATAQSWHADIIVMGRSDKRPTGQPYVGSQTEHVLEFTEVPVIVVPEPSHHTPAAGS